MGTEHLSVHTHVRGNVECRGVSLSALWLQTTLSCLQVGCAGWLGCGIGFASLCNTYFIPRPRSPDSSPRRLPVSKANSDNAHAHSQCIVDDPPQRVRKVVATREQLAL